MKFVIDMKLPSLNDYILACRKNRYEGAKMKRNTEAEISWYIVKMPRFKKPIRIHFHWIEASRRRDLDNIAFAKKFILDAMVKSGKLPDDSKKYVVEFSDTFSYSNRNQVILYIDEVEK